VTAGVLSQDDALAAVAAVAAGSTGAVGLAARHLESGETLAWRADEQFRTASTIKVAIHAAVMRRVRLGVFALEDPVELRDSDYVGGSGVLAVMRPGLRCTVSDLCTLMIVVSDNTATNMLIDLCGGVEVINGDLAALGFPGIRLNRRIGYPPPPLTARGGHAPAEEDQPAVPLASVRPAEFGRLMAELHAGTVVDEQASAQIIAVMRHQQHQALFPRAYLDITEPGDPAEPDSVAMAHKTGSVGGCRTEAGLLYLPDGGTVAYAAAADRLADRTMTALAEGNQILGRLGAIVLACWWPGPAPVPVRDGWLPAQSARHRASMSAPDVPAATPAAEGGGSGGPAAGG
jgi:beta-lactamase class A